MNVNYLDLFNFWSDVGVLEGFVFQVFTENQILNNFSTKPILHRREARWLDFFNQFGITKFTLKSGRLHPLVGVLFRALHVMEYKTVEYPVPFDLE